MVRFYTVKRTVIVLNRSTMTPSKIGNYNKKMIFDMVRRYPGISRRDISKLTGMDPSTVTRIVSSLIKAGYLKEVGEKTGKGRGRKAVNLAVNSLPVSGIIVLVGAQVSKIGIAFFDGKYEIVEEFETQKNPRDFLDYIRNFTKKLVKSDDKRYFGMIFSIPGIVDLKRGVIRNAPHLGWKEIDLKDELMSDCEVNLPFVLLSNEAKLSLHAESWFNKDIEGLKNGVYIYHSEGVGGALLIEGKLYRGVGFSAGEIGHMVIDFNGKVCHCGNRGCWETFISSESVVQSYEYTYGRLPGRNFNEKFMNLISMERLEAASVFKSRLIEYIALGIANLMNILNPEFVLLGGVMHNFPDDLIEKISDRARALALSSASSTVRILKASMDMDESRMRGATLMFVDKLIEDMVMKNGWRGDILV